MRKRAKGPEASRLNIIQDVRRRLDYSGKDKRPIRTDARVVFPWDVSNLEQMTSVQSKRI